MSKWDNRLLWKYYDYHKFGIVGEPYFDVNFNEVLYLTDTGRRWNGGSVSIRDKATGVYTLYALRFSLNSTAPSILSKLPKQIIYPSGK